MSKLQVRVSLHLTSIVTFLVPICFLVSCTTMKAYKLYEGQQLPDEKAAYLVNKGSSILVKGSNILIHSVDGLKSPDGEKIYSPGAYELLPGDHTLTVSFYRFFTITRGCESFYYRSTSTREVDVTLRTEAGHTYFLTSQQDPKKEQWYFIVTDEAKDKKMFEAGPYPCETVKIWHATPPVCYCCG
jgi:hypothetical protein